VRDFYEYFIMNGFLGPSIGDVIRNLAIEMFL
jgi:hypothetical protein